MRIRVTRLKNCRVCGRQHASHMPVLIPTWWYPNAPWKVMPSWAAVQAHSFSRYRHRLKPRHTWKVSDGWPSSSLLGSLALFSPHPPSLRIQCMFQAGVCLDHAMHNLVCLNGWFSGSGWFDGVHYVNWAAARTMGHPRRIPAVFGMYWLICTLDAGAPVFSFWRKNKCTKLTRCNV